MQLRETSEPHPGSTDNVSSKPTTKKTTTGKKTFRTITKEHVLDALNNYLHSLKMIDVDEYVTYYNSIENEIKVETKHD